MWSTDSIPIGCVSILQVSVSIRMSRNMSINRPGDHIPYGGREEWVGSDRLGDREWKWDLP